MTINIPMVRESFGVVKPIADQVVSRFYENLFADFPASTGLFVNVDMTKQRAALLHSLVTAVDNLDNPDVLTKFLLGLGERHVKYGTEDIHYEWVGQSLLKTFGQFLGASWTKELCAQWTEVYGVIAQVMKKGAQAALNNKVIPIATKERLNTKGAATPTSIAETEIPPLSNELKEAIRLAVKAIVSKQIKAEVQKCFEEEMREIEHMSPEDLVRKAG